jgi:hypothetical protein
LGTGIGRTGLLELWKKEGVEEEEEEEEEEEKKEKGDSEMLHAA